MPVDSDRYIAHTGQYLQVSAERRIPDATAFLAEGVSFVFPNGTYQRLDEVFAGAAMQYRWIRKRHQTWDVVEKPDGSVVVVSVGTLHGENQHGVPFDGIRYIDRITWRDDRIVLQEVWNDLAASGVLSLGAATTRT